MVIFRQYMMMRCSEVFDNVGRWWSVVTENLWINGGLPQSSLIAVKYWLAPKLSSTSQQKKSSPTKLLSFHCLDVRLKTQEYSCNTHYLRGAKQNLAYSVHQSLPAINILSSLYHNHVRVQTCERRSWQPPSLVRWVPPSWVPPPSFLKSFKVL